MSDRSAHNDAENIPADRPEWLLGDSDDTPGDRADLIEPSAPSGIADSAAPVVESGQPHRAGFDSQEGSAADWQWDGSSEALRTDDTTGIIGRGDDPSEVEPVTMNAYSPSSQTVHRDDLDAVSDPEESFEAEGPQPMTPRGGSLFAADNRTADEFPAKVDNANFLAGHVAEPSRLGSEQEPVDVLANRQGPDRNYQPRRDYDLSRIRDNEPATRPSRLSETEEDQDSNVSVTSTELPLEADHSRIDGFEADLPHQEELTQANPTGLAAAAALLEDDLESTSIRRQSLLQHPEQEQPAANNASWRPRQDEVSSDEVESSLFADSTVVPEVPTRTGARLWSLLLTLLLAPVAWYLLTDAAARLTLARANPWQTGVVNYAALGELAAGVVVLIVILALMVRSSLGAILWGFVIAVAGGTFLAVPHLTVTYLEPAQEWLRGWNTFGQNVAHHLEWTGSTGTICVGGLTLFAFGIIAIMARRDGKREYQIRDQIERMVPGSLNGKRRR